MGELAPVMPAGGYSVNTALGIATDTMLEMIAERFNFKWNRERIPPFYTNSWQQDYAQLGSLFPAPIGWLEGAYWIDINNTALPKPTYAIEVVRDLPVTSISGNPPGKICWLPNSQLVQGVWPGAAKLYTPPLGALITPTNPPTNILDADGNILILTTYGTTGMLAPVVPANSLEGVTVNDGSCVWTVASPDSQGFRVIPLPPQQGVVYQVNVIAQRKAPAAFTAPGNLINPIPDDYAHHFRNGYIAGCHKMSPNPQMRALYHGPRGLREAWLESLLNVARQGDREPDNCGFIPDRSVIAAQGGVDIGPANPFLYSIWPGR